MLPPESTLGGCDREHDHNCSAIRKRMGGSLSAANLGLDRGDNTYLNIQQKASTIISRILHAQ